MLLSSRILLSFFAAMALGVTACDSNYSQVIRPEAVVEDPTSTTPDSDPTSTTPDNTDAALKAETSDPFGLIIADNSSSQSHSFTLTGVGPGAVSGINFQPITGDAGYFSVENSGGGCANANLAKGQTCTFNVKFGPTLTASDAISSKLPIAFTSTAGASTIQLTLSGSARAPLEALVYVDDVSSTMPNGTGKFDYLPFQVITGSATSSTLTLTYRNGGLRPANHFIVNTTTQLPTGYTLQSTTCNDVTLQASKANSCTVTLSPTAATVGALNIEMSSSTLSGQWTDEAANVSNRGLYWNTGNGTQNTIYAKIYSTHTVTATMTLDSAGTQTIQRVKVGGTYYIALESSGNYEEYTTYTITSPTGFSPTSATCKVTSASPRCYVAVTVPSSASTNQTISISSSIGVAATPSSFTFDVRAKTLYAYISLNNTGVIRCTVDRSTGALTCPPHSGILQPGASNRYRMTTVIDPTQTYLFSLSYFSGDDAYYACAFDVDGNFDDTACLRREYTKGYNMTFAATNGTMMAYVGGVLENGYTGAKPNFCSIFDTTTLYCQTLPSSYSYTQVLDVKSMVIGDDSYVYSINNHTLNVSNVTQTIGILSTNTQTVTTGAISYGGFSSPLSLAPVKLSDGTYHLFALDYTHNLVNCVINSSGTNKGRASDCFADDNTAATYADRATSVGVVNTGVATFVYLLENPKSIEICKILPDGTLTSDSNVYNPCDLYDISVFSTTDATNIIFAEF